ncbi:MAG: peptide synthase, partial [Bacteroidetes bacterium]
GTKQIQIISTANLPFAEINLDLPNINPTDPAYVLFTSGSTGIPKGVPISYNNINSFMNAFYALGYKIDENDRFLQVFDLSFDLSVMSYLAPLQIGACAYTVASGKTKYLATYALLEEQELTFALMVPSVLNYLKPYFDDIRLEKLRYSLFCGEALYEDMVSQWANCVPNALIQNVYGPTEATIFCLTYDWKADHSPEKAFNGIVSIGKPMKNMSAVVVNEKSELLAQGEKGELCLLGGQLTAGYWNNPEKNAQAFFITQINGVETVCYRTGDIAFVDKDGDFTFCGRVDHQVKVQGGYRVELSEIEHYARQFTNLNVAAVAKENAMGISQIYLFLEKYEGKMEELSNFMIEKLPSYMQPSKILNLDIFPLNVNGKIDRKVLKDSILN